AGAWCDPRRQVGRIDERRIPTNPTFPFAPRIAAEVGRRAVIHDAPVRGPRPTPFEVRAGHAWRIGLAPRGEILIPRRETAGINPRRARRRAVVFERSEPREVLLGVSRHVAVDLAQHLARADLSRV